MTHTLWLKAVGLMLPVFAVLQSGPLPHPLHLAPSPSPRELILVSPQASSFHTLTMEMGASGLRMQLLLLPASAGTPVTAQDRVFSLHPQLEGEEPLSLPALLIRAGANHA